MQSQWLAARGSQIVENQRTNSQVGYLGCWLLYASTSARSTVGGPKAFNGFALTRSSDIKLNQQA
jgi:hypothetical protein